MSTQTFSERTLQVAEEVAAELEQEALRARGYEVELVTPDAEDPLGGALNITGDGFDLVQVINFENPFARNATPATTAIRNALVGGIEDSRLRVVTLPDLVALKLYAGGPKSRADVAELLVRNPEADRAVIRRACEACHLEAAFDQIVAELNG